MSNGTNVKKRNGSIEPLNLEKIHNMCEEACEGLAGGLCESSRDTIGGYSSMMVFSTAEIQENPY